MNYYLDTEFHEYKKQPKVLGVNVGEAIDTIELISIGIVAEDGREYYAICNEFDLKAAWDNEWLRENILRGIGDDLLDNRDEYFTNFYAQDLKYKFFYRELKKLLSKYGKSRKQIAKEIINFCSCLHPITKEPTDKEEIKRTIHINNQEGVLKYLPKFYAYYADYDWVVFCWLFGRMVDLPKGFPMYCIDLNQSLEDKHSSSYYTLNDIEGTNYETTRKLYLDEYLSYVKTLPSYPKQTNEHNALADAKWNKRLHSFITTL